MAAEVLWDVGKEIKASIMVRKRETWAVQEFRASGNTDLDRHIHGLLTRMTPFRRSYKRSDQCEIRWLCLRQKCHPEPVYFEGNRNFQ